MKARMAQTGGRDKSISCSSRVQDESKDGKDGRETSPSPVLAGYKMKARMAQMGGRDVHLLLQQGTR